MLEYDYNNQHLGVLKSNIIGQLSEIMDFTIEITIEIYSKWDHCEMCLIMKTRFNQRTVKDTEVQFNISFGNYIYLK